jgi:2-dehydropantoate 2-reductase
MTFSKICIYGAGAIGGWMGARLAQMPGVQLSAVARGATLQALQTHGLQLNLADHSSLHTQVEANHDPQALGVQDLVIVAVKGPSMSDVAQHIAPLIGKHTVILTAMNGVPWWFLHQFGGRFANRPLQSIDPQGTIAQHINPEQIIGCVVHASCSASAPAQIQHHFGNGLIIGEPNGQASERALALHRLLQAAGFDTTLSEQIQKDIWYKLWGNMSVNPVSALTGATADKILDDTDVRNFLSAIMLEAKAIGACLGIPIEQNPEDRHAVTRKLGAFKTSMLQDVEQGRAIELDALVGAVAELGRLCEIDAPFTRALLGLTRLKGQMLGLYPTATVSKD